MNTQETKGDTKNNFEGDKLDRIFAAQKELMQAYKPIAEAHYNKIFKSEVKFSDEAWAGGEHNLHTKEGNYLIRDMLNSASQEIGETIQTMKNWKSWKSTEVPTDVEHFREELIDVVHFLVEAAILAGMTPEDLYNIYFKKNEVNHFRQESNY